MKGLIIIGIKGLYWPYCTETQPLLVYFTYMLWMCRTSWMQDRKCFRKKADEPLQMSSDSPGHPFAWEEQACSVPQCAAVTQLLGTIILILQFR